jgi:hypothetical protein
MTKIILFLLLLLGSVSTSQDCPAFAPGDTAFIVSADAFNGQPVVVFQPGITQDGAGVWVVELLREGQPRPFGYLGVSACNLER